MEFHDATVNGVPAGGSATRTIALDRPGHFCGCSVVLHNAGSIDLSFVQIDENLNYGDEIAALTVRVGTDLLAATGGNAPFYLVVFLRA